MKILKRVISIILVVIMLLSSAPLSNLTELDLGKYFYTEASAASYSKISLKVPWFSMLHKSGCGIASVAMVEAYEKGYGNNDKTAYNAVYNYNGKSVTLSSYSKLGYSTVTNSLESIYNQLKKGNPVIIYRTGGTQGNHYSVVYEYSGSTSKLEKSGFKLLNTYRNDSYTATNTVSKKDFSSWLGNSTWKHTLVRTSNKIPLVDLTTPEGKVFKYLTRTVGLNAAAAVGFMANIKAESNFNPKSTYDEGGFYSYGLCQWNRGRKNNLDKICKEKGLDSNTIEGQLVFIKYELENGYKSSVLNNLKKVSNSLSGAKSAAEIVCRKYEVPANIDAQVKKRQGYAETYWKTYGAGIIVTFDGNGGTASKSSESFDVGNIYGDIMPSATRNGYTFEGWYTAKTGGSRVNRSSTVTSGNKTLYAQWKKNETDNLKVGHVYRIYNENSGLVVAGNGSGDGAYITQRKPGEKGNGELWRVVSADANGYYKFENLGCGKAMDMAADNRWAFRAPMQIMRHKEVEAQMFSVIRRKDKAGYSGLYSIHCKYNGKTVDVSGNSKDSGAQLHSWDYHGGSNQLFYFEEVTTRTVYFYDNHNNNYIPSPKEVYEKYGVASPKENYNTRAAEYATVTIKPEQNSIEIKALKAGQSGKDLRFDTTVNGSYDYDFSVADDSLMVLKFRAKSSVSGAKIYFRWGWDSTYKSVELTTGWKEYTVELPRTRTSGSNIHPYIDKACTIEMADIALYEKGKEGYIGDTDMHTYKSITADIYKADSCLAPEPISYKDGYAFDGWYTKRVGGVKVADAGEYYDVSALSGNQRLYAHWVEDDTPCEHTAVITDVKFATCTEQGYTTYICENCGYSYECEYVEPLGHQNKVNDPGKESTATEVGYTPGVYCDDCKTWLEGHEEIPVPVEYRYKVKEYITSDKKSVDGYTLIGSDWESEPSKTETVTYVKAWPSGSSTTNAFKTDSSLYKKYKKPSVSETETTKTVLGDEKSAKVVGYIYWHWCYTHTAGGPINCKIGGYKGYKINSTYSTNNFHAFYTTSAISYNSSAKAYKKSSSSVCPYTYWWSGVKAGTEGNIQVISNKLYTYEKEYYHYKWSEWSEWSATPVEESEDVIVEMRVNAPEVKEGSCGENVTYKLSPDGTLIISGEGPMYDYSWDDETASTMPSYMIWDYDADGNIIGESKIKKVIIQNGVTSIGNYAFNACTALESVEIADTVTSIGNVAFDYCINLKNITLPSSVKRIGEEAFSESALESISLPNGLEEIDSMAFMYCKDLTSVTVPETVTSIGSYAFMLCNNLDRLVINSRDCKIGDVILLTVETDDEGCIIEDETGQTIPVECRTVIRGLEGSTAEAYADMWNQTEYPISFEEIQHYYEIDYKVSATCAQDGYSSYVCLECGEEHIDDEVDATGHKYEKIITKATLTENGEIETVCTVCGETANLTEIKSPATFELSATSYIYNGKAKTPSVTVKDSKGNTLKKDTDYTVKYESGRKTPGKYTVQITFKGNYSGTKKLYFTIAPKATSKIAATQNTSAIKLAWAKVAGASGYRIYYNSGSGWKTAVSSITATSYTFKNLKASAKFKFRVRAYTKDSDVIWGEYSADFETATKPATPALKAASAAKNKVTLAWKNVSGENGYQIYYSTKKDSGFKLLGSVKADTSKVTLSKLTSGKTYYFKVRAYTKTDSGTVYSSWSSVKGVKVK